MFCLMFLSVDYVVLAKALFTIRYVFWVQQSIIYVYKGTFTNAPALYTTSRTVFMVWLQACHSLPLQ